MKIHIKALIIKRYKYSIRDYKGLLAEILLPCLIVIGGLGI